MSRSIELRLLDIVESCEKIAQYIEGLDVISFEKDCKTQDAVIRHFEILANL